MGGIRLLIPCEDAKTVVGIPKCNSRMVTTDISFSWTADQSLTHGHRHRPRWALRARFSSGGEL